MGQVIISLFTIPRDKIGRVDKQPSRMSYLAENITELAFGFIDDYFKLLNVDNNRICS